jgi:uncharacterized protein YdhG (YjbR/CyaY superfamily)
MAAAATVEQYLAALPETSRAALEEMRAAIRAAAPDATEGISYGMPAFRDRGRVLVYYAAFKGHYSLFPASVAVIEALGVELRPHVASKGTLRFRYGEPLPIALVTRIVELRLAENAARRRR